MADLTFKVISVSDQDFETDVMLGSEPAKAVLRRRVVEAEPVDEVHVLTLRVALPVSDDFAPAVGDSLTVSITTTPAPAAAEQEA